MLEPEFCRLDFDSHEMNEAEEDDTTLLGDLHDCMKRCATPKHPFGDLVAQYMPRSLAIWRARPTTSMTQELSAM